MSTSSFALAAVLALPLALLGAAPPRAARPEPVLAEAALKERDHESLGQAIGAWIEATIDKGKSTIEARDTVFAELDKWSKKREVGGRDPLSLTEDLGRALWYSKGYADKGIKKGKVTEIEVPALSRDPRKIEYAMLAPSKYRAADGPYPFIICIPDKGEKPADHLSQQWMLTAIRDAAVLAAVPMPEADADWTGDVGTANFFTVFNEITRTYAVDFDRIYLSGRGKGVEAAMVFASRFPDRFAGVVGRAGDAGTPRCENFSNLPSFFAGAGKQATDYAEACKAAGHDNVTLLPTGKEEEIWAWIQSHPRKGNPEKVVLVPGSPFPNKAYWVEVDPQDNADGKSSITATIDRATNTIQVEAKGISVVRLYFNDLLIDLSAPVKVVCNGVENEDQIPRGLNDFLDLVRAGRNDPGKLYTASMRYDVPARE